MNGECLNCVARKFCYYDEPAEDWTCEHREAMEQEYDKINGIKKEQEHTCEFCYYEDFDDKAYPCSRCVCNMPTENMWKPKEREDEAC